MRNLCVAAILTFAAQAAMALPPPFVRILLPLYNEQPLPGAYGSLWQSGLVIHNGSLAHEYQIITCPPNQICQADSTADEELRPGETQVGLPVRYPKPANPVAGAIVWLVVLGGPFDNAEPVSFQLRVVDLSRAAIAAGTEMPVVRESEFRSSTVHLLNVPTDSRFRLALRLFEMNLDHANFIIRVIDQSTNDVLFTRLLTTTMTVAPGGFTPAFSELDDLLSAVASPPNHVRIEIEPRTAGVAFWPYVSITNNDSQQITLVTPQ